MTRRVERNPLWHVLALGGFLVLTRKRVLCALAALVAGCAHAPAAVPRPVLVGDEGEPVAHFFARLLVDACTARQTDETLIGLAAQAEATCPEPWSAACNHAVCAWLSGDEGCAAERFRHTGAR